MGWQKLDTETLSSGQIEISLTANKKFVQTLHHVTDFNSASGNLRMRTDSDGGVKYADRASIDGAADATTGSRTEIVIAQFGGGNYDYPIFDISYWVNISGEEKLGIIFTVGQYIAGAGTAPSRQETVAKSIITTTLSTIDIRTATGDNQEAGTNGTSLGTD